MVNEPTGIQSLFYLAFILGFFAHATYENSTKIGPLHKERITSNIGSTMMYIVWLAAIIIGLMLTIYGLIQLTAHTGAMSNTQYFWVTGLIFALFGALSNRAAVYRARDAGRSRLFALLAIIPIANLWLVFASPKVASERPPYTPAAAPLRIFIGIAAFVMILAANILGEITAEVSFDAQVAEKVVAAVAAANADLPKRLDNITILQIVEANRAKKEIVYRYTITTNDLDPKRFQNWLEKEMKPATLSGLCSDPAINKFGWSTAYRYWDEELRLIGETKVTGYDCKVF
ncbi:hypothetical protein ACMG4P_16800 [Pseudovibrio denitrificans]|uniref:hypothetical protein n=1 Tax=Pseudovibrio denitrificans TaxID=258256 RepID=UPI0039BF5564